MKFADFNLYIVRECTFKLDGGAMFGVVPKTLWQKSSPADESNRILLKCNLLVIKTPQGNVLIETGMGSRWPQTEKERYGLVSHVDPIEPLASIGMKASEIDYVIISHMHFDHIGGATVLRDNRLVPTFPKARYCMQKGEWEFAHKANARARASYRSDDYEPIKENGQLQLVDGDAEILPGISVHRTGGHTSHHQIITFTSGGKTGVYFADIMPTASHVNPAWVMGYDHFPLASCDIKSEWLKKAADNKWLVVFDHEPGVPWGYIEIEDGKKYIFRPLSEESLVQ